MQPDLEHYSDDHTTEIDMTLASKIWRLWALAVFFQTTFSPAHAQSIPKAEGIALLREEILKICQNPNEVGTYLKIEGDGKGEVSVGIVKLLGKAGAEAKGNFTKEEWAGVRKVLDQNSENNNFRACVVQLTPLLIDKFFRSDMKDKQGVINIFKRFKPGQTDVSYIDSILGAPSWTTRKISYYDVGNLSWYAIHDKREGKALGLMIENTRPDSFPLNVIIGLRSPVDLGRGAIGHASKSLGSAVYRDLGIAPVVLDDDFKCEPFVLDVDNALDDPATVGFHCSATDPDYKTYNFKAWTNLDKLENKAAAKAVESAVRDYLAYASWDNHRLQQASKQPCRGASCAMIPVYQPPKPVGPRKSIAQVVSGMADLVVDGFGAFVDTSSLKLCTGRTCEELQ
jgi:hypothetical protein